MRRLFVTLVCCVALQAILPAPAHGWWEKIEEWSGPGPFSGWTVDGRLVCFTSPAEPRDPPSRAPVITTQPVVTPQPGVTPQAPEVTHQAMVGGLVYSACQLQKNRKRRASIDLGMRFLSAEPTKRFGNEKEINFTSLEPSFSWRVIEKEAWDFFDYGIGAGIYWVSSEGFPSVRGAFLEPFRLDFHATTRISRSSRWWWLGMPMLRVGLLVFPAGHETTAFAPDPKDPEAAERIARDRVWTKGFYVDLDPLIDKIKGNLN